VGGWSSGEADHCVPFLIIEREDHFHGTKESTLTITHLIMHPPSSLNQVGGAAGDIKISLSKVWGEGHMASAQSNLPQEEIPS
jgi:hypothetical protein